jgi:hypothetical protein
MQGVRITSACMHFLLNVGSAQPKKRWLWDQNNSVFYDRQQHVCAHSANATVRSNRYVSAGACSALKERCQHSIINPTLPGGVSPWAHRSERPGGRQIACRGGAPGFRLEFYRLRSKVMVMTKSGGGESV